MGIIKKMDWLKWIRKYSAGILDTKTGSMETLIDSGSSKSVNYAYTSSSEIADDELVYSAAPPRQRPMLPTPPLTSQDSPSTQQLPNNVYDCCVSLDGIPIKHEFQYTLSDTGGRGKITKHDIEGLASKILESMYGTTAKFSSQGQRTVKVTLNVRQSAAMLDGNAMPSSRSLLLQQQQQQQSGCELKSKLSSEKLLGYYGYADEQDSSVYGEIKGSPLPNHHRVKSGAQRYRRDQLIEMVQKSLAENLSFQNQRKSNKPEGYHRPRTKRRQSSASIRAPVQQSTPLPSPPLSAVTKPKAEPKVAWSPYDFEPAGYIPSHHHRHEQLKNVIKKQQQLLYGNSRGLTVVDEQHVQAKLSSSRQQRHRAAIVASNNQKPKNTSTLHEQTKNVDYQRYKRAKLASKKIYHHIHEHHHYHHYNDVI